LTVPPAVSSVALATGEALPVAFVSLVMVAAVAVPLDEDPKAVADSVSVDTAVPGDAAVPLRRKTSFPGPPGSRESTTRSQIVFRIATG
jgi:hypothetical protein